LLTDGRERLAQTDSKYAAVYEARWRRLAPELLAQAQELAWREMVRPRIVTFGGHWLAGDRSRGLIARGIQEYDDRCIREPGGQFGCELVALDDLSRFWRELLGQKFGRAPSHAVVLA
jgi:hypothetical protein